MYRVTKREGNLEPFDISRIENAIRKAFMSCETEVSEDVIANIAKAVNIWDTISIEDIQDQIIELLGDYDYPDVAAAYRSYKDKQSRARMLWRKIHYMDEYIDSNENAAISAGRQQRIYRSGKYGSRPKGDADFGDGLLKGTAHEILSRKSIIDGVAHPRRSMV